MFFALLGFYLLIRERKSNHIVMAILCIPVLVIMSPFVKMFPVGLGLKILYVSAVFIVLIFGLLLPVFGSFKYKKRWSYLSFILAIGVFIYAHTLSGFSKERPKPNSLVYMLDADKNEAQWMTYDKTLDPWSKRFIGETTEGATEVKDNTMASKYNSGFTYSSNAEVKALVYPTVEVYKDTIIDELRHLSVYVESKREVNRIEVFAPDTNLFSEFAINGVSPKKGADEKYVFQNRYRNRLFSYYVSDNEPLTMEFVVSVDQTTTLEIYEASFDLLENRRFEIPPRGNTMIPKPFVLNDAVVIKKTIIID